MNRYAVCSFVSFSLYCSLSRPVALALASAVPAATFVFFFCLRELDLQEAALAMESRFWTHQVSVIFPLSHTPRCEILKSLLSVLKSVGVASVSSCRIVGFAGLVILLF